MWKFNSGIYNNFQDIDETGSQSSEEQDLQPEMDTEDKKTL